MAVVDASVIIATIHASDPYHEVSKRLLDDLIRSGNHFSAPTILLSEVSAPLSWAYNRPELAQKVVETLMAAPFIKLFPVSVSLAHQAAVIAATYQIRGCDAIYVALAETLDEELITLEKQQGERAKNVKVHNW